MSDSSEAMLRIVRARHAAMSPLERMRAAAGLYDVAVRIVDSSIPDHVLGADRRYAVFKRIHGDSMPEDALRAAACYPEDGKA
jgi:hypothetical protein